MVDLEPQPGQNVQFPWDLEPQPQAKLLLYGGPGATARPKFSILIGPGASTTSQIIVEWWTWSRSQDKMFNFPGTSSHNPKPNYCCTVDLEPQPGQSFQSPWDLEPRPQSKLLLYSGPGATDRPNFQSPWDLEPQPQAKLLLYEGPGAAARH